MAGNSELMDAIKKNVDNHHAKLSDALYEKWLEFHNTGRIENRESAFHLSVVIDLKTDMLISLQITVDYTDSDGD